ncbi:hypothetical protein LUZ60_006800 [Juncus effusus]|nr:hypothetical protein LUZ60_006800 [Juncus effusus]
MAQFLNEDLEFLEDDFHDMIGFDDDFDADEFNFAVDMQDELYDDELANEINNPEMLNNDTSAAEYRNGKDMQGIPWDRLNYTRDDFRALRLKQYTNYQNLSRPRDDAQLESKESNRVVQRSKFYDFQFNSRLAKSTIVHFQLRNLVWATSKHDVYIVHDHSVMHYSPLLQTCKELINASGRLIPHQSLRGSSALSRVQICSMAVKDNFIAAGGFHGELICKYSDKPGVAFCAKLTEDDSAITNSVDIYQSPSGSTQVICGNNDSFVRVFDTDKFSLLNQFPFSWSVNSACVSPDGKLLAVLGDSTDCIIADPQSGKVISNLKGHEDYSFSCAWHPSSHILATGNQDKTCRLWDVRNTSESLAVLKGRIGAIRGIKFSSDGNFLAFAEPADFVHVYDVKKDYCSAQEIDLFGEISGICFSPDCESLFVGMSDRTYGSLLEFKRRHMYQYLDLQL